MEVSQVIVDMISDVFDEVISASYHVPMHKLYTYDVQFIVGAYLLAYCIIITIMNVIR